jgi:hypothetical protein
MTGARDVADLTGSLVEWVHGVRPDATVLVTQKGSDPGNSKSKSDKRIMIGLSGLDGTSGPRTGEAVVHKLQLAYSFEVDFDDAMEGQQALVDLAFALLERDDLRESGDVVQGADGVLSATFVLNRRRDLPRAKPVREAVINLHPQSRVSGVVQAEGGVGIARARLQVHNSDRLIVTENDGQFAFAAPEGIPVRATVSAKGRTTEVELKPGDPNIITLSMES